jgi:hypothetical protein
VSSEVEDRSLADSGTVNRLVELRHYISGFFEEATMETLPGLERIEVDAPIGEDAWDRSTYGHDDELIELVHDIDKRPTRGRARDRWYRGRGWSARRGDNQIGLREGMPSLAAFLDQKPPFEHDLFCDGKDALLEHWPHLVRKPVIEFGALSGVGDKLNAEADFCESHGTYIELFKWMRSNEGEHFALGLRAAQLGEDIRIEQPTRHRSTPRTGIRSRFGSMSISR